MGLTIHYSLRAKGKETQARKLITALHQAAHDLPFKEVGNIIDLEGSECDFNKRDREDPLRWLLCQAQGSVQIKDTHRMPNGKLGGTYISVIPNHVLAFTAWPGDGCEESNIGFCHYPDEIFSPNLGPFENQDAGMELEKFL